MNSCGGGSTSSKNDSVTPPPSQTSPATVSEPTFTDVTSLVGIPSAAENLTADMGSMMLAGITVGDYDKDGWLDIYITRPETGNLLYRNNGANGSFSNVTPQSGLGELNSPGASAIFADFDADGWLDLFVSSFANTQPTLFRNKQDGTFENITVGSGFENANKASFSMAVADYDNDGDMDLFITHWQEDTDSNYLQYLWNNRGDGSFIDASVSSGISALLKAAHADTFTPTFTDLNNDGWLDLTLASDFKTSQVLLNTGGTFIDITTEEINDKNGMGSSVGDIDNDGDFDWFVTAIWDPPALRTGNRLYKNDGHGNFTDISESAGVREGFWGWGSCFADFNNDTFLDIFHVNGFGNELVPDTAELHEYYSDPSRLFMSNGDLTFTEKALASGIDDDQQGRGIICFDYDRDGDLDILISNFAQPLRLYRNNTGNTANYLNVKLTGNAPNTQGIGAKVRITSESVQQIREIRNGNNYLSANPVDAHFGLGSSTMISELEVVWPNGDVTLMSNIAVNQMITITQPQ